MDLWIPSLRLVQDFTNKIDGALDLIGVPSFFSVDDNGGTDNAVGCSDVDQ